MNLIARAGKRVLVFSPHADDAELGCGGYIARCVDQGSIVCVVVATVGKTKFLHLDKAVTGAQRLHEFYASMVVLGVHQTHVLTEGFDSKLNMYPMGDLVAKLDELQEEFKPDEVLIPLPSSHQDHVYCWDVGVAATRPSTSKHQPSVVAAYEYPSTCWGSGAEASSFRGGIYVDISEYWEKKQTALSKYVTQMREGQSLISTSGVDALSRLRGIEAGFTRAELFHALRITVK